MRPDIRDIDSIVSYGLRVPAALNGEHASGWRLQAGKRDDEMTSALVKLERVGCGAQSTSLNMPILE